MKTFALLLLACGLIYAQAANALLISLVDAPNTPADSPGAGTYSSTQSVTLTDATAQFINYTTDGSTPACPATGTLYTGAFNISVTTTLKAIGCNGISGGGVLTSVYTISGGGSVSISHSGAVGTGTCNDSTTCTISVTNGTGDAIWIMISSCMNSGCNTFSGCTTSIAGNSYTYSAISGATFTATNSTTTVITSTYYVAGSGTTAATFTATFTVSGTGCKFYFGDEFYASLSGANSTTPIDSGVSNTANGISGTTSVTSSGNITNSGEVALAYLRSPATQTNTGSFSVLTAQDTNKTQSAKYVNPPSGSGVTASATSTSGNWWATVVAFTP